MKKMEIQELTIKVHVEVRSCAGCGIEAPERVDVVARCDNEHTADGRYVPEECRGTGWAATQTKMPEGWSHAPSHMPWDLGVCPNCVVIVRPKVGREAP